MNHFLFDGLDTLADDLNTEKGTSGADTLTGTAGDDKLLGAAGDDALTDTLGGNDLIIGGAGDDVITIERAATSTDKIRVQGGVGDDQIDFAGAAGNQTMLKADGGAGANTFNIAGAYDSQLMGGRGIDTVTLATNHYSLVHTAASNDVVSAQAQVDNARTGISSGAGDDTISLQGNHAGLYTLRLGDGQDTVTLGASSDKSDVKLVFLDFLAGDSGDKLDLSAYLGSVLDPGASSDPFANHQLRLVDGTTGAGHAAAFLEMDVDGDAHGAHWVKLAVFEGVHAADLTSFNLGGLDPVVSTDGLVS